MLTVETPAPNRVDMHLNGTLDSDMMRAALDDLIAQAKQVENGRMLYRVSNFTFPTLGALAVEMSRMPDLLRLIGRFERCAVLCDIDWIRQAAEVEGRMLPGIEIRAWPVAGRDAAERWLEGG